jgi:hypothetical protein
MGCLVLSAYLARVDYAYQGYGPGGGGLPGWPWWPWWWWPARVALVVLVVVVACQGGPGGPGVDESTLMARRSRWLAPPPRSLEACRWLLGLLWDQIIT